MHLREARQTVSFRIFRGIFFIGAARLRGEFRDLAQVFGNRTWLAGRGADGYVYLFLNQIIS
jgi:hypothetical protein